jgi:hypothetical protein
LSERTNEEIEMSSQSQMSDGTRSRISQNRHVLAVEQNAARDLEEARRARATGEDPEYVPLWRRNR